MLKVGKGGPNRSLHTIPLALSRAVGREAYWNVEIIIMIEFKTHEIA